MVIPFTYLGLQVERNHRRCKFWQTMIMKITKRLAKWKAKSISFVGRITLIKYVLSTLHISFYLSSKCLLESRKKIRKIQRIFYKRITWLNGKNICKPNEEGGYG